MVSQSQEVCVKTRRSYLTAPALIALIQCSALGAASAQTVNSGAFNRADWADDYATLKRELERSYSHLVWFGSSQSGVDLPALDRATLAALERAHNDTEAAAAITAFVAAF